MDTSIGVKRPVSPTAETAAAKQLKTSNDEFGRLIVYYGLPPKYGKTARIMEILRNMPPDMRRLVDWNDNMLSRPR